MNIWVARDKDGYTALWSHKPMRYDFGDEDIGQWCVNWDEPGITTKNVHISEIVNAERMFPNLKWENEPIKLKLIPSNINDETIKSLAKESWFNLTLLASAPHVVDSWNNYIKGFEAGYKKALNE